MPFSKKDRSSQGFAAQNQSSFSAEEASGAEASSNQYSYLLDDGMETNFELVGRRAVEKMNQGTAAFPDRAVLPENDAQLAAWLSGSVGDLSETVRIGLMVKNASQLKDCKELRQGFERWIVTPQHHPDIDSRHINAFARNAKNLEVTPAMKQYAVDGKYSPELTKALNEYDKKQQAAALMLGEVWRDHRQAARETVGAFYAEREFRQTRAPEKRQGFRNMPFNNRVALVFVMEQGLHNRSMLLNELKNSVHKNLVNKAAQAHETQMRAGVNQDIHRVNSKVGENQGQGPQISGMAYLSTAMNLVAPSGSDIIFDGKPAGSRNPNSEAVDYFNGESPEKDLELSQRAQGISKKMDTMQVQFMADQNLPLMLAALNDIFRTEVNVANLAYEKQKRQKELSAVQSHENVLDQSRIRRRERVKRMVRTLG